MRNIEKLAYREETAAFFGDEDEEDRKPYLVLTEDLHCVELALRHCKDMGRPVFSSVGDMTKIVSHARTYDYPKTSADLKHLHELYYISEQRRELEKTLVQSESSQSSSSSS